MTFAPQHTGLTFLEAHIQLSRQRRDRAPLLEAWKNLLEEAPLNEISLALWQGFRYRLDDDPDAGEHAVDLLQNGIGLHIEGSFMEQVAAALPAAQCFELVRDHPSLESGLENWLGAFRERAQQLFTIPDLNPLEMLWRGTLQTAAGIVLEDAALFDAGIEGFRQAVDEDIHPEGYLRSMVNQEEGHGYERLLLGVGALAFTAEMAAQAEVDLWGYQNRGVSLLTTMPYLLYYYFYPEKWRWSGTFDAESTRALLRQHGAFIEFANSRAPVRGIEPLLDEQRPFFCAYCGGLTTLTHAKPRRRGLFG